MASSKNAAPMWRDVNDGLADFDRASLLGLVQDLDAASKDHQTSLHPCFGLGNDVLKPSIAAIDRWLWPEVSRNQATSLRLTP